MGPNNTTVEYGEDDFDIRDAAHVWDNMVPSSQNDSAISSSQQSGPDCVYCQNECENWE